MPHSTQHTPYYRKQSKIPLQNHKASMEMKLNPPHASHVDETNLLLLAVSEVLGKPIARMLCNSVCIWHPRLPMP